MIVFLLWNNAFSKETSTSSRAPKEHCTLTLKMETPRRMWPKCLTRRVLCYFFSNYQALKCRVTPKTCSWKQEQKTRKGESREVDGRILFSSQTRGKRRAEPCQRLSVTCAISEFLFSDAMLTEWFWMEGEGRRDVKKLTTPIAKSDRVQERPVLALENFLFSKFV